MRVRRMKIMTAMCPLFVAFIFGCGSDGKDVVSLKIAHGLAPSHPVHKAMEFMAQKVLEKSDSTLTIEVYPSEQLGNEKECLEKVQLGAIAMTKVSSSGLESFIDEYKVFALPYLFKNEEHRWHILNGDVGKKILASGERMKLKGLGYYDAGYRSFYTVKKPILTPDDLAGLKIRVQQSPMAIKLVQALGGSPTPISWGELYTALQQGVVDGAENNPPSLFTSNHYEVCKHYSLDQHTSVPDVIVINTFVWNRLSEAHKQALQEAVDESVEYQRELWRSFEDESMQKMQEAGLQVYTPDKKLFSEKARSVWAEFDGTVVGDLAKEIEMVE